MTKKEKRDSLKKVFRPNLINKDDDEESYLAEIAKSLLVPYKDHPLFTYLHQKNTLSPKNTISIHNDKSQDPSETITLVLKPVARAIAGDKGKAIATPLSRAILRYGTNVDILFEPEAVAIAGPGGIAHAESDLEISYEDTL